MHPSARQQALSAFFVVPGLLALVLVGCGLDAPQAPSFQTEIHIPIGKLTYTVAELIESEDALEADSTGTDTVFLSFSGAIDPVDVRDRLTTDIEPVSLSAELGELEIEIPSVPRTLFNVKEFVPFDIPPAGLVLVVPPFEFGRVEAIAPPFTEFEQGTIRSGQLRLTLTNELPVAIEALTLQLRDLTFDREIRTLGIPERIEPGGSTERTIDLAGKTIGNSIGIQLLSGRSPGSVGPIRIDPSDAIALDAELTDVRFSEATAPIPPQTFDSDGSTEMVGSLRVMSALIGMAEIPVTLESTIPVPVTVTLSFPELRVDDRIWSKNYPMEPGLPGAPARLSFREPLDDSELLFDAAESGQRLHYFIQVDYAGSGDEVLTLSEEMGVSAELDAFTLDLDEIVGILEPRSSEITPTRTTIDIPEEAEGLEFVEASLTLEIVNEAQVPGTIELTATGTASASEVAMHLTGEVAPATPEGGVKTVLTWNEANSNVLDLVNLRPDLIEIAGSVHVGDSTFVSTVRAGDTIMGSYEIRSPLRVRIGESTYQPDPFDFEISEEIQERIRDNVIEATAALRIDNNLPAGAVVSLQFASDSSRVYADPEVTLESVHVPAGLLDPGTGRVIAKHRSDVEVEMTADDVPFFARERIYGGVVIRLDPTDGASIELLTGDAIEIDGMVTFKLRVD